MSVEEFLQSGKCSSKWPWVFPFLLLLESFPVCLQLLTLSDLWHSSPRSVLSASSPLPFVQLLMFLPGSNFFLYFGSSFYGVLGWLHFYNLPHAYAPHMAGPYQFPFEYLSISLSKFFSNPSDNSFDLHCYFDVHFSSRSLVSIAPLGILVIRPSACSGFFSSPSHGSFPNICRSLPLLWGNPS